MAEFAGGGSDTESESAGGLDRLRHSPRQFLPSLALPDESKPGQESGGGQYSTAHGLSQTNDLEIGAARDRQADDDGSTGGGDEDEELDRLRRSSRYALYAATYERIKQKLPHETGLSESLDDGVCADDECGRSQKDGDRDVKQVMSKPGTESETAHDKHGVPKAQATTIPAENLLGASNLGGDDDDDDDDGILGPSMPPGYRTTAAAGSSKDESRQQGNQRRAIDPKIIDDSDSAAESGEEDTGEWNPETAESLGLPVGSEAVLGSRHAAQVCALSLDPAGARVASSSADAVLRLWDFNAMDRRLLSLREMEPLGGAPVVSARFSGSGGKILCAGGLTVARVLDREGSPLLETCPGDMYIVDMARTKGHVAEMRDARWISSGADRFATIAGDGTLRTWDAANATAPASVFDGDLPRAIQIDVVKLRNSRGSRTNATAMAVLPGEGGEDKKSIALGCDDGAIKILDPRAFSVYPAAESRQAISEGARFTSLECSPSLSSHASSLLLARSTDDALRVFDFRKLDAPLAAFTDLPNVAMQTGVTFVGTGAEWFATGTSANRRGGTDCARIQVFDTAALTPVWHKTIARESGSVVSVTWQSRINQLFYGCADGSVHVMYSSEHSQDGILRCVEKSERRKQHGVVSLEVGEIYTPSALPMFRDASKPGGGHSGRKRARMEGREPQRADVPDETKLTSTLTRAFMQSKVKKAWADEDPREALLKLDEAARSNPVFTSAYKSTQPNSVLAAKTAEEEQEEERVAMLARNRRASKDHRKTSG